MYLSFLVCAKEMIVPASPDCCENSVSNTYRAQGAQALLSDASVFVTVVELMNEALLSALTSAWKLVLRLGHLHP